MSKRPFSRQSPPRQDARFPAAHAHARRAQHRVRAPPQGPQRTVRLSLTARVLPSTNRMRRSTDFASVVRAGFRARAGRVVVHHAGSLDGPSSAAPLVGFVVSKAVGNSVQRHAVTRRLRAQLAARVDRLPAGSGTVVRALPAAASADSADLGRDLDRALSRLSSVGPSSAGPSNDGPPNDGPSNDGPG